jgi:hypothetical protein
MVMDVVKKKLMSVPIADGKLTLADVAVDQGPQIFRILNPAGHPQVVWHDHVAWRVVSSGSVFTANVYMLAIELAGVPQSESLVYLYHPQKPAESEMLVAFDEASRLATYKVKFDRNGKAKLNLTY